MNGFTERRAFGTEQRPDANERVLTWETSFAMLALVRRIVADVLHHQERLTDLRPERDQLERNRLQLPWTGRARRYEIEEEMKKHAHDLRASRGELEALGVALLDAEGGLVGFPTIVNNRRAFFSWQSGEEGLTFWNFAGDLNRRPVPASWTKPAKEKAPMPRRSRRKWANRTRGQGDKGTRGQGDKGTRGQGDKGTRGQGDKGTRGQGDKGTNTLGLPLAALQGMCKAASGNTGNPISLSPCPPVSLSPCPLVPLSPCPLVPLSPSPKPLIPPAPLRVSSPPSGKALPECE